jgi:release factor glutamine methyltransferase
LLRVASVPSSQVYARHLSDPDGAAAVPDVYPAQHDSHLLIDVMCAAWPPTGRSVADLCTGSGVVALAAAKAGAASVTAIDLCPAAVACARSNTLAVNATVDVHLGPWSRAIEFGPYDLVLCNPPYVPQATEYDEFVPASAGPALSFNAGIDGRLVLDPLCEHAPALLKAGGTLLVVQSEFAGVGKTVESLCCRGLRAAVVAHRRIPFGPVMTARAQWLEGTGRLQGGRRYESLFVIAAVKP